MIVKLLNGELLEIESVEVLPGFLGVHPSQLRIIGDGNVLVLPRKTVCLPLPPDEWVEMKLLSWCKNVSIVNWFKPLVNTSDHIIAIYSNPLLSPDDVDWSNHFARKGASANPSDNMVDYLLSHPEYINVFAACSNPNGRMLEYVLTLESKSLFDWMALYQQDHSKSVELAWEYFAGRVRGVNSVMRSMYHILPVNRKALHLRKAESFTTISSLKTWAFGTEDDELIDQVLAQNEKLDSHTSTCDRVVDWLLANPEYITSEWSANSNPKAVEYMLKHPELLDLYRLASNPNERAVEYIFRTSLHSNRSFYPMLLANPNPEVTLRVVQGMSSTDLTEFLSSILLSLARFDDVDVFFE